MFQHFLSETHRNDGTVIEEDNMARTDEGVTVSVVLSDLIIPVSNVLWGAIRDGVEEQSVGWRLLASRL